jgi:hypothetical protein
MRYLLRAKARRSARVDLLKALEDGSFGKGFPYGDLGVVLCTGRVDETGVIRWVEVCYCREYYGVAMHEELPYLEKFLTEIEVADARSPRYCKGYPECNDCDCTRKVRFDGEPLLDNLRRTIDLSCDSNPGMEKPTRWLGWRGHIGPEEARRNEFAATGD